MKRIVSMLTRLIQRTETVSEGLVEYEHESEYRDADSHLAAVASELVSEEFQTIYR